MPLPNPREPLTQKARNAIGTYASIKGKDMPYHHFMVTFVLQAERMKRSSLYSWLEKKGYTWKAKAGLWVKNDQKRSK
jgi:hypothetical protein